MVNPWVERAVEVEDLTTGKAVIAAAESGHADWLVVPTRRGHAYRLSPRSDG